MDIDYDHGSSSHQFFKTLNDYVYGEERCKTGLQSLQINCDEMMSEVEMQNILAFTDEHHAEMKNFINQLQNGNGNAETFGNPSMLEDNPSDDPLSSPMLMAGHVSPSCFLTPSYFPLNDNPLTISPMLIHSPSSSPTPPRSNPSLSFSSLAPSSPSLASSSSAPHPSSFSSSSSSSSASSSASSSSSSVCPSSPSFSRTVLPPPSIAPCTPPSPSRFNSLRSSASAPSSFPRSRSDPPPVRPHATKPIYSSPQISRSQSFPPNNNSDSATPFPARTTRMVAHRDQESKKRSPGMISGGPQPKRAKRKRKTPEQLAILEKEFKNNPMPNKELRDHLSAHLGLTSRQVQIWFQNKRAKVKNNLRNQHPPDPDMDIPSLPLLPSRGLSSSHPLPLSTRASSSASNNVDSPLNSPHNNNNNNNSNTDGGSSNEPPSVNTSGNPGDNENSGHMCCDVLNCPHTNVNSANNPNPPHQDDFIVPFGTLNHLPVGPPGVDSSPMMHEHTHPSAFPSQQTQNLSSIGGQPLDANGFYDLLSTNTFPFPLSKIPDVEMS
eukprot:CAMPEP_0174252592 /NCGR_PEP_ID=MMETSP0439-20130205/1995_1 /TAXON_ID=0 /ORGANISM="Stereomyxa ramosa, Strain Chinc5" /LENGTH=549 /DNA_ID=CAMNT_0015333151 /DNA_START=146 /DNA_END=1795 /DNA_ORIENTATION=+